MKKVIATLLSVVLLAAMLIVPVSALSWQDNQTQNEDGLYIFDNAYGFVFNVKSVNGVIAGEDATIVTSTEKYNASNAAWAISVVLDKVEDNVYSVNRVIECPKNGLEADEAWQDVANVTLTDGQIVLVVHSAASFPEDEEKTYPNWQSKVAALALKEGDKITLANIDLATNGACTNGTATVESKEDASDDTSSSEPVVVPETITVDGKLNDNGWKNDAWTEVTPDNGYGQAIPKTADTLSYKFQLRADDTKLYGAFEVDCALVSGGNGAGTNARVWFRTNSAATVYTHFYDINAAALVAKKNTALDKNSGANIENSTLVGAVKGEGNKTYMEFSVDLAEFGGEEGFDFIVCVSNKVNENVCLYYPATVEGDSRLANLPYNAWDADKDIEVDPSEIALGETTQTEGEDDKDEVVIVSKNVALNKTYTGGAAANTTYTANLTDGVASNEAKYESMWFGLYHNAKATTPSVNAPDGVANIVIDLEEVYDLNEVKLHFWNANASGIAAPASIAVSVSEDGTTYSDAIAVDPAVGDAPAWTAKELGEVSGRYVKFTITMAEGATWCFLNEIEVYGDVEVAAGDVSDVPSTPGKPNTPVKPGDASNSVVFVLIALIAMAGSAVVIKNRK